MNTPIARFGTRDGEILFGRTDDAPPPLRGSNMAPDNQLSPHDVFDRISNNIESVMKGQSMAIRRLLAALAS
ncbi:MAG: hypothetical protein ACK4UN_06305, partial [Limisphaerales bacterium]